MYVCVCVCICVCMCVRVLLIVCLLLRYNMNRSMLLFYFVNVCLFVFLYLCLIGRNNNSCNTVGASLWCRRRTFLCRYVALFLFCSFFFLFFVLLCLLFAACFYLHSLFRLSHSFLFLLVLLCACMFTCHRSCHCPRASRNESDCQHWRNYSASQRRLPCKQSFIVFVL